MITHQGFWEWLGLFLFKSISFEMQVNVTGPSIKSVRFVDGVGDGVQPKLTFSCTGMGR